MRQVISLCDGSLREKLYHDFIGTLFYLFHSTLNRNGFIHLHQRMMQFVCTNWRFRIVFLNWKYSFQVVYILILPKLGQLKHFVSYIVKYFECSSCYCVIVWFYLSRKYCNCFIPFLHRIFGSNPNIKPFGDNFP